MLTSRSFRLGSSCNVVEMGEPTFKRDQGKPTYKGGSPGVTGELRGFVVWIDAANRLIKCFERRSDDGLGGRERSDS